MTYETVIDALWIIALLGAVCVFLKTWPGRPAIYRWAAIWGIAGMEAEKVRAETKARLEREFGAVKAEQGEVRAA